MNVLHKSKFGPKIYHSNILITRILIALIISWNVCKQGIACDYSIPLAVWPFSVGSLLQSIGDTRHMLLLNSGLKEEVQLMGMENNKGMMGNLDIEDNLD